MARCSCQSCETRRAMTRAERHRFDLEDKIDEAMEHAIGRSFSMLIPEVMEARPLPPMFESRHWGHGAAVVYSSAARARIIALRSAGVPFRAIAKAVGGSRSGVRKYWINHGGKAA